MSDPIVFPSTTPVAGLPLLIAGQAQKEFFVNEALSILDALLVQAVNASQPAPPPSPTDSDCYRVTAPATGAWAGREDRIAVLIAGEWHFIAPAQGMAVFDRAADCLLVYRAGWKRAQAPSLPSGGAMVDTEARAVIAALIGALKSIGILAAA
jgi:hypothetical protein